MNPILCIILVTLLVFYFLWTRREFYKFFLKFPGPLGYPLIGISPKVFHKENVLKVLRSFFKKHGNCYVTWLGPEPFLITSDPQATQDILTSPHCVNKSYIYKILNDAVGYGLFSLPNPRWTKHSKILSPAFNHKTLLSFFPIFNTESGILLNELNKLANGREVGIMSYIKNLTLSIATQTLMGTSVKEQPNFQDGSLIADFKLLQECATDFIIQPWFNIRIIRKLFGREQQYFNSKTHVGTFSRKLVDQKLSEDMNVETLSNTNIAINLLMKHFKSGRLDKNNVEDEVNTMIFAAFETSANTVGYTLMLLAMFPEYQEKAFEELQTLFPKAGDFSVSYEDTQQMVYLDLVLNESMRLIAPVPLVGRETSHPVRLSNGAWIPKGMQIAINIFEMHRRKDIWGEDSETFNPDHFLPHNMQDKHPYAFIPFTKGIRSCIGWRYGLLSTKVTLAKLLRNYKFSTCFDFKNLEYIENITMKLATMPLLKMECRN